MKKGKRTKTVIISIVITIVLLIISIKGINQDFIKGKEYIDNYNNFQHDYPKLSP